MTNLARLLVRLTVGGLLAGHGAQKLFGWFGGPGIEGTSQWLESMNLRPGHRWAILAGGSEFMGGVLTILGLLNPVGPLMAIGAMLMATVKVHAGRPIWVTTGGAELPVTNIAVAAALTVTGPGAFSLDRLFGIQMPRWVGWLGLPTVVATVLAAEAMSSTKEDSTASEHGGSSGSGEDTSASEATSGLSAESEGQATVGEAEDNFESAAAAMSSGSEPAEGSA